jgi:lipopolysaccharide transport system ATP-binding protein
MSTVIQIDRVSKQYRLGQIGGKRLVDDVNRWWARLRGKEDPFSKVGAPRVENPGSSNGKEHTAKPPIVLNPPNGSSSEHIWALKDVSLEVKEGEVLGIIGRNGAGKSTLLKILSRVTAPSSGEVRVKGRIASLLEVGTGFHPELTGRENLFLNGAILGMRKSEIRSKLDEIVDFSGVEKFIDTPVKRYSSGMTVRLAFAVAAHLDPEILILDEVLAVGDIQFQKKCIGKMSEVANEGRTVLFVSHNMSVLSNLCTRALQLQDGKVVNSGSAKDVISKYLITEQPREEQDLSDHKGRKTNSAALMRKVSLRRNNELCATFKVGEPIEFVVDCDIDPSLTKKLSLGFIIKTGAGNRVLGGNMRQYGMYITTESNRIPISVRIDQPFLAPGIYNISLFLGNGIYDFDAIEDATSFEVMWQPRIDIPTPPKVDWGPVCVPITWNQNKADKYE